MRLLQKVWPWNPRVSWFSWMSNCRVGLSMKMDREIQNISVNLFARYRDYKCKSLFADVFLFPTCPVYSSFSSIAPLVYSRSIIVFNSYLLLLCSVFPSSYISLPISVILVDYSYNVASSSMFFIFPVFHNIYSLPASAISLPQDTCLITPCVELFVWLSTSPTFLSPHQRYLHSVFWISFLYVISFPWFLANLVFAILLYIRLCLSPISLYFLYLKFILYYTHTFLISSWNLPPDAMGPLYD